MLLCTYSVQFASLLYLCRNFCDFVNTHAVPILDQNPDDAIKIFVPGVGGQTDRQNRRVAMRNAVQPPCRIISMYRDGVTCANTGEFIWKLSSETINNDGLSQLRSYIAYNAQTTPTFTMCRSLTYYAYVYKVSVPSHHLMPEQCVVLSTQYLNCCGVGGSTHQAVCQPLSRVPEEDPRGHVQPPPPHCVKCSVLRKLTDISPKNDACDC